MLRSTEYADHVRAIRRLRDAGPADADAFTADSVEAFEAMRAAVERRIVFGITHRCVAMSNHSDRAWRGELLVRRMMLTGDVRAMHRTPLNLAAGTTDRIDLPADLITPDDPHREVLVASMEGAEHALSFFVDEAEIAWPEPSFDIALTQNPRGARVIVTADVLLRDVCLCVHDLDPQATITDAFVTLLPGESRRFIIDSERPFDEADFRGPVFQCVNRLSRSP